MTANVKGIGEYSSWFSRKPRGRKSRRIQVTLRWDMVWNFSCLGRVKILSYHVNVNGSFNLDVEAGIGIIVCFGRRDVSFGDIRSGVLLLLLFWFFLF